MKYIACGNVRGSVHTAGCSKDQPVDTGVATAKERPASTTRPADHPGRATAGSSVADTGLPQQVRPDHMARGRAPPLRWKALRGRWVYVWALRRPRCRRRPAEQEPACRARDPWRRPVSRATRYPTPSCRVRGCGTSPQARPAAGTALRRTFEQPLPTAADDRPCWTRRCEDRVNATQLFVGRLSWVVPAQCCAAHSRRRRDHDPPDLVIVMSLKSRCCDGLLPPAFPGRSHAAPGRSASVDRCPVCTAVVRRRDEHVQVAPTNPCRPRSFRTCPPASSPVSGAEEGERRAVAVASDHLGELGVAYVACRPDVDDLPGRAAVL